LNPVDCCACVCPKLKDGGVGFVPNVNELESPKDGVVVGNVDPKDGAGVPCPKVNGVGVVLPNVGAGVVLPKVGVTGAVLPNPKIGAGVVVVPNPVDC